MNHLSALKLFNHPENYLQWYRQGYTSNPITVKIDLTNVCNHRCPHCIDASLRGKESLNIDRLNVLLDELAAMGTKGVHYTGGGEPLLYSHFEEAVAIARNYGIEVGLLTNGSLLNRVRVANCSWVRVSLDAYDEKSYQKTHGKGADWETTIEGIKDAARCVRTTVSYLTADGEGVEAFLEIAAGLGVQGAQVSPYTNIRHKITHKMCERWERQYPFARIHREKFSLQEQKGICQSHWFKATNVCATGKVYICCQLAGQKRALIGDIYRERFRDIWTSTRHREVAQALKIEKCPRGCVGATTNQLLRGIKGISDKGTL